MTAEQRKAVEEFARNYEDRELFVADGEYGKTAIIEAVIAGAEFALEKLNQENNMTREECIEKLKDLGVYEQFVKNLTNIGWDIETYKPQYGTFCEYIAIAFYWPDTPEGWEFWNNIANK